MTQLNLIASLINFLIIYFIGPKSLIIFVALGQRKNSNKVNAPSKFSLERILTAPK